MKSAVDTRNILALSDVLGQQPEECRRMSWPMVQFGRLYAEPSRNGIYKSRQHHGAGVKIVNMGELFSHDIINRQEMKRVHMTGAEMTTSGLRDGDLLFGRRSLVESGAGKCSLVEGLAEPTTFESSLIRVRVDQSVIRARFVFYWLKSHQGFGRVRAIVTGTNIKGIRGSLLKKIEVPCPPLRVQDAIVSMLSTYDDLIENNRRRIRWLEQVARVTYNEWFVHLRFPGCEHAPVTGGIPRGWKRRKIGNICETVGGGTPSTNVSEYWDGEIPWIVPSDVTRNDCLVLLDSERKITEKGLRDSSAKMVPANTILMTSRASVGFFALVDTEVCTNQGFINIVPQDKETGLYLLFNLASRVDEIRRNAKGTTYPEINKARFREMDVVVPSLSVTTQFAGATGDIVRQVRCLKRSVCRLTAARDTLLRRLMKGGLAV